MIPTKVQIDTLRKLGARLMEAAQTARMAQVREGWKKLNAMHADRPMITIDQLPWNELEIDDSLTCVCDDPFWNKCELEMRRTLFKYDHFRADMIIPPYFTVSKVVSGIHDMGVSADADHAVFEKGNSVVGQYYHDKLSTDEDVEKLKPAPIVYDEALTMQRFEEAKAVFEGVMPVVLNGVGMCNDLWDKIATLRGVEEPLYDLVDRPEFIHKIMTKLTDGYLWQLDQLESRGLLGADQQYIHCTGALTDELPKPGFNPDHVRSCDIWTYGLAQMLSTVSPDMFDEFEIEYARRWTARFGLAYYGCCDPLDHKMKQVRRLPNVRKVSMSPWTNCDIGAAAIAGDYVFSSKPSPALLAGMTWEPEAVRDSLTKIKAACERNNCCVEFILKDVSTIRHDINRLIEWEKIARKVANS